MRHPEPISANLYTLYCNYIQEMNRSSRLQEDTVCEIAVVTEADFLTIWNALPEPCRNLWRRRFEAGHDEVAGLDRRKLVAAFSSNNVNRTDFNAIRAA